MIKFILIILLCLISALSAQDVYSGPVHTVGERGVIKLSCLANYKIKVVWAFYGLPGTNCKSLSTIDVTKRCDGLQYCEISATNNNFGDPCPGRVKSLSVLYRCEFGQVPKTIGNLYSGQVEMVREHETMKLSCSNNLKIEIVWALYGVQGSNCKANTLQTTKNICNGKNACHIGAHNSVFGDPCPGVVKTLSVIYRCYSELPNYLKDAYPGKYATVMEQSVLKLDCPLSRTIFIDWALYGVQGTNCAAETTLDVIKQRCDGLRVCEIRAINQNFGDPCAGPKKSLSVLYRCLTKEDEDCLD